MTSFLNTETGPDSRDMLGLLLKHGVEFLIIGGYAMGAHHVPRHTGDIDFFVRPSQENAERLWKVLKEFGAPMFDLTVEDLTLPKRFIQFGVAPHRIDFTMSIEGVSFDEAWRDRIESELSGHKVWVLSRKHLMRNKKLVARPKDIADIAMLKEQDSFSDPKRRSSEKKRRTR
jgi:hypothetical protein